MIQNVLYHYTHMSNAAEIVASRQFRLTPAVSVSVERTNASQRKRFYLSTTRSRFGSYTEREAYKSGVVFVLDKDWLESKMISEPYDYWGPEFHKMHPTSNREFEDRMFYSRATLPFPGASHRLIKEIHVLLNADLSNYNLNDSKQHAHNDLRQGRNLFIAAKKQRIPIFAYTDRVAFIRQQKPKAVPISDLIPAMKYTQRPVDRWPQFGNKKWFLPWIELYHKKPGQKLSEEASKLVYNLRWSDLRTSEMVTRLENDFHNNRRKQTPDQIKLLDIFKRLKIVQPKDYIAYLKKKWGEKA
jgi:hypothetical protein